MSVSSKISKLERILWVISLVLSLATGAFVAVFINVKNDISYLDDMQMLSVRGAKLRNAEDTVSYFNNIEGITAYRRHKIQRGPVSGLCYRIYQFLGK